MIVITNFKMIVECKKCGCQFNANEIIIKCPDCNIELIKVIQIKMDSV